jgi:hypothetical protein
MTKTTKTPAERRAYFLNAATEAFNNGFSSKAGAKAAMADLNRVWDSIGRELKDACLAARTVNEDADAYEMTPAIEAVYWDFADYPHLFKAKHRELVRAAFGDRFDALLDFASEVVELRAAIKAAPVAAPAKNEAKVIEARIVESIKAQMDRLNVRYLQAIDLTTVFEDGFTMKGLSANSHYVTNEHGTTFLRTFFYLNGKLTPLNLIIAAAQEAKRRAEAEGR